MSTTNIIRAWKDPEYRESLSEAEIAGLPQNPAGLVELTDEALEEVGGARKGRSSCFMFSCNTRRLKPIA